MPNLRVLTSNQQPIDQDNNIVLTEVVRPGHETARTRAKLLQGSRDIFAGIKRRFRSCSQAAPPHA
jgi:hypothetical protein